MPFIRKLRGAALALLVFAAFSALCGAARADGLEVHFMDIDRNDGILITCDGEAAFIDSGWYEFTLQAVDYMKGLGLTHIKYYIGTHAHNDHVSGASAILLAFSPEAVLQPHADVGKLIIDHAVTPEERAAAENARYINVSVGQTYTIGGAKLTVLGPLKLRKFYNADDGFENYNSLICRLTYGETSFLLTGDAYSSMLCDIEAVNPGALRSDVVKNPHHSHVPSVEELEICAPKYVVFSTSNGSLPNEKSLNRVANAGALALITASNQNSHVVFHSDGHNLTYTVANGPTEIILKNTEISLYEGKQASISLKVRPSNYKVVTYVSLNAAIATVDHFGRVTGVSPGTTVIRALAANGVCADCTVTVLPVAVELNKERLTIKHGDSGSLRTKLRPSGTRGLAVTWSSDDPAVASVASNGRVTGVAPGVTTVRATLPNGSQAACAVTVEPVAVSSVKIRPDGATVTIHQTQQLTASVSPKNATDQSVVWSSADESIALVDQNGFVTAVGVGRTKITATASSGKNRSVTVTVKPVYVTSVTLAADKDTIVAGVAGKNTMRLAASIQPRDATIQTIVWKTSNARVAAVDENGLVTAVGEGRATIYAVTQDGSRRQGSFRVTVAANRFERKAALLEPGRVTVSAKAMRYERDTLRIDLYYANGADQPATMPAGGVLTFILPDGRRLPVMPMEMGTRTLRCGSVRTITVKLPLAGYPYLAGLDLAECDATVTE